MSDTALGYRVIHPLDDVAEVKLYRPELGRIQMTRTVRISLILLRFYMALMLLLLLLRLFGAG